MKIQNSFIPIIHLDQTNENLEHNYPLSSKKPHLKSVKPSLSNSTSNKLRKQPWGAKSLSCSSNSLHWKLHLIKPNLPSMHSNFSILIQICSYKQIATVNRRYNNIYHCEEKEKRRERNFLPSLSSHEEIKLLIVLKSIIKH